MNRCGLVHKRQADGLACPEPRVSSLSCETSPMPSIDSRDLYLRGARWSETLDDRRRWRRDFRCFPTIPKVDRDRKPDQSFVERARRLDTAGNTDIALDLIYDAVDRLMRDHHYDRLDSMLAGTSVRDISVDVLLGLLTATLPARRHLPSRRKLFREGEQVLKERGEYEEGLLVGLEG